MHPIPATSAMMAAVARPPYLSDPKATETPKRFFRWPRPIFIAQPRLPSKGLLSFGGFCSRI